MEKVGKICYHRRDEDLKTEVEWVEGMQSIADTSPCLLPTRKDGMRLKTHVLLFEKKISNIKDFIPILSGRQQRSSASSSPKTLTAKPRRLSSTVCAAAEDLRVKAGIRRSS